MSQTDLTKILTVSGEGQGHQDNGEAIQLQNMNHKNSASSISSGFHSSTSNEALRRGLSLKQDQQPQQRPPQVPERPPHTLENNSGEPRVPPPPSYESAMKDIC